MQEENDNKTFGERLRNYLLETATSTGLLKGSLPTGIQV